MKQICLGVLAALVAVAALVGTPRAQNGSASHKVVTKEQFEQWKKEYSNWGRWGRDDQLGAVNLITPAKRKQAAALVKEGYPVSLAHDAVKEKAVDNPSPFSHVMTNLGADPSFPYCLDTYSVSYHGWAHTHMDSICHMFH